MKTDKWESIINPESAAKCYEYSENVPELRKLLAELKVEVIFTGIKKYFPKDKEERLTGLFRITRDEKQITFPYGFSIKDTELYNNPHPTKINYTKLSTKRKEFKTNLLYDCLTSCKMDYFVSIDFDEFCDEFGYSNDSITDKQTWERCLKQSAKLQHIFKESEIDCLPS